MLDGLEYQQLSQDNAPVGDGLQEVNGAPEPMAYSPAQTDLNEARQGLIDDIQQQGTVYGK